MAMEQSIEALTNTIEHAILDKGSSPWPQPSCPTCSKGNVVFRIPYIFKEHQVIDLELQGVMLLDDESTSGTFRIEGQCNNENCRQVIHGSGTYTAEPRKNNENDWGEPERVYRFKIGYLFPSIMIMSIPPSAPPQVREHVIKSSRALFVDPGLAATALRSAVEFFLTTQGVPLDKTDGSPETLNKRIEIWKGMDKAKNGIISDLFDAVRWIGNTGTHDGGNLTIGEFLEGAEILDDAFHRVFTGSQIHARAKSITGNRGPLRTP